MSKQYKQFPILWKELTIDKKKEQEKKTFEKQIFFLMAAIYCQDHHLVEHKISVPDLVFPADIQIWLSEKRRVAHYQLCSDCYDLILGLSPYAEMPA